MDGEEKHMIWAFFMFGVLLLIVLPYLALSRHWDYHEKLLEAGYYQQSSAMGPVLVKLDEVENLQQEKE